eukprot:c1885_g1_i1.p1 GENE.c1885_g1_i1~~c1885_g1_i1.p1  ORF type:complete len:799 (-),score=146.02 c1885_g1_i1:319-2544(-)
MSERERTIKSIQGLLNKLTVEMFDSISKKFLSILQSCQVDVVRESVHLIFTKATNETHFVHMYAMLCCMLAKNLVQFLDEDGQVIIDPKTSKPLHFKRLLVEKCQVEFEEKHNIFTELKKTPDTLQGDDLRDLRKHMIGISIFVGELYKEKMLATKIIHRCIASLMEGPVDAEIETVCRLLSTTGMMLDADNYDQVSEYFNQLNQMKPALSSRVRFLIEEVAEQRENRWSLRQKPEEAKALREIRADVNQESRTRNNNSHGRRGANGGSHAVSRGMITLPPGHMAQAKGNSGSVEPPALRPSWHGSASLGSGASGWTQKSYSQSSQHNPSPRSSNQTTSQYDNDQDRLSYVTIKHKKQESRTTSSVVAVPAAKVEMDPRKCEELLREYFDVQDIDACVEQFVSHLVSRESISMILICALDRGEAKEARAGFELISNLHRQSLVTTRVIEDGFTDTTHQLHELSMDVPFAPFHFGTMIAECYMKSLISASWLNPDTFAEEVNKGLIADVLASIFARLKEADFSKAKSLYTNIPIKRLLTRSDQPPLQHLHSFLQQHDLLDLDFALEFRFEFLNRLKTMSSDAVVQWIEAQQHTSCPHNPDTNGDTHTPAAPTEVLDSIARSVMICFVELCFENRTKVSVKSLFNQYHLILKKAIGSTIRRQHIALVEVQIAFHEFSGGEKSKFASELLLTLFEMLYDQEVIFEDSFMEWKDAIDDSIPGKTQCLFAVNKFLTWLQEAEEESD